MPLILRRFQSEDASPCFSVFYKAVHEGTAPHYTSAQRHAWAPQSEMPAHWCDKLLRQACWVADEDGDVVGFMSLESDGHLDMAFVAPEYRRTDVAGALYNSVIKDAHNLELPRLFTEASHLARPFFEKRGWHITKPETITRSGVDIERFQMAKNL